MAILNDGCGCYTVSSSEYTIAMGLVGYLKIILIN